MMKGVYVVLVRFPTASSGSADTLKPTRSRFIHAPKQLCVGAGVTRRHPD
jgi:hypothetical protein